MKRRREATCTGRFFTHHGSHTEGSKGFSFRVLDAVGPGPGRCTGSPNSSPASPVPPVLPTAYPSVRPSEIAAFQFSERQRLSWELDPLWKDFGIASSSSPGVRKAANKGSRRKKRGKGRSLADISETLLSRSSFAFCSFSPSLFLFLSRALRVLLSRSGLSGWVLQEVIELFGNNLYGWDNSIAMFSVRRKRRRHP